MTVNSRKILAALTATGALAGSALVLGAGPASAAPTECEPGTTSVVTKQVGDANVLVQSFVADTPGNHTWSVDTQMTESATVSAGTSVSVDAVVASAEVSVGAEASKSVSSTVGASLSFDLAEGETRKGGYYIFVADLAGSKYGCSADGKTYLQDTFSATVPTGIGFG